MNIYKTGDAEAGGVGMDEVATPVFEGEAPEISVAGSTLEENQSDQPTTEEGEEGENGENTEDGETQDTSEGN